MSQDIFDGSGCLDRGNGYNAASLWPRSDAATGEGHIQHDE